MGCHERRQRYAGPCPNTLSALNSIHQENNTVTVPEFAGTLLGFDDYVSLYTSSNTVLGRSVLTMAGRYGLRGRDGVVSDIDCWSWSESGSLFYQ